MLSAARVDDLALALVLLSLAVTAGLLVRERPRLGLVAFMAVLAFVPNWFGVTLVMTLSPVTAVCLVLLPALWRGARVRPVFLDLVVALVLGLVVVSCAAGYVSFQQAYGVLVTWGVPYAVARVVSAQLEAGWVSTCIAVVMTVVAALALIEFLTDVNVFVRYLRASNGLYARWGVIQVRGGISRAEGAFGHSIALGGALAMAVPFVWVSRIRPGVKALSLVLVVGASVVTFSRIGMGAAALAVLLCVVFLRSGVTRRFRVATTVLIVAGVAAALPFVSSVFSAAGGEAEGSAEYRGDLLSLVPRMSVLGQSPSAYRDAAGTLRFGSFESIDSAFLLTGLEFGALPLVVLLASALAAVLALLRGVRSAALVSVVAILPAFTSVAFITQFTELFWFVVGLAATYAARPAAVDAQVPGHEALHTFHPGRTPVAAHVSGSIPGVEGGRDVVA